jgi:hypothetical protein
LLLAAVVDRAPNCIDSGRDRPLRNHAALPHRVYQIIVAGHALAIDDQKFQDIENLWLYGNGFSFATQLAAVTVKAEVFELIDQMMACLPFAPERKLRNPKEKLRLSQRPVSRQPVWVQHP